MFLVADSVVKEKRRKFSTFGFRLETLEQNLDSELVTGLRFEGDGPVLGLLSLSLFPQSTAMSVAVTHRSPPSETACTAPSRK